MRPVLPAALSHVIAQPDRVVRIGPGEFHVSRDPAEAILTTLGSCVAVAITDLEAGVGGLNHFMLPESGDGSWGKASAPLRYGNYAMERLVNEILQRGGHRARLRVKLFGGARLRLDSASIGPGNVRFVDEYLRAEGMVVLARSLGGTHARRVCYLPVTGRAFQCELHEGEDAVGIAESRARQRAGTQPVVGHVELFD
jgi:chemotaxis protein CheD